MYIVVFPADDSNLNLIACFLNDLLCPGHLKDQDLSYILQMRWQYHSLISHITSVLISKKMTNKNKLQNKRSI